ncbi:MAG: hypothetical protein O7E49_08785 [Gemmatimonadetes bacterium]|nr:hypothetical protein [Gemmatimonadota bacterium]
MNEISLLMSDLSSLSMSLEQTIVYALWYSTLFWLPIRGAAAMIDHFNPCYRRLAAPELATTAADNYCIGKEILPPM